MKDDMIEYGFFHDYVTFFYETGSTQIKPLNCHKLLTNFITQYCMEYTLPERDSNSQH